MGKNIIKGIHIYPIKSLRGISLNSAFVEERGLRHDRRYMLVDSNNDLLTQRDVAKMATLSVNLIEGGLVVVNIAGEKLEISEEFKVDKITTVRVWNSYCEALVAEEKINRWFSENLQIKCRLVKMPESTRRAINPIFNVNGDIVSFADGYPILITSENSLDDLNEKLTSPIQMDRFRPNIVVSGSKAFAEDDWKKIEIRGLKFRVTKPCARCVVTTIDQQSGVSDIKEPLKTLATYRKAKQVFPKTFRSLGLNKNDVLFGTNLVPEITGSEVRVGNEVRAS